MDHEFSIKQENYWFKHFLKAIVFFIASLIVLSLFRIFFSYYFSAGLNIAAHNFLPALGVGIRVDAKWLSLALLPAFWFLFFHIGDLFFLITRPFSRVWGYSEWSCLMLLILDF
ncbi:MAG: hypothetical protein ACLRRK_08680 [Parasutterella sp.]